MKLRSVLGAALALSMSVAAFGQDKLKVGDNAPGLDIETWVKGTETSLQGGNVYVVEFWATWCGPCKKSIPHLTAMQKEYADQGLTIIGVSTDAEQNLVDPFVRKQGSNMDYTVAIDRRDGTKHAWLDAAGQNGIPCAFIVDRKGKIAFIGNPLPEADSGFDETLKKVMTGRYDPKLEKQAAGVLNAARNARKVKNWKLASMHYDEVVALDAGIFANVALEQFEMMLVDMGDKAKAYEYGRTTLINQKFASDVGALQMLAEKIAVDPKIEKADRDLNVALEAAEAANRLAPEKDSKSLAVLASVRFARGEVDKAVDLQKQAWFNGSPKHKAELKRTLDGYLQAQERTASLSTKTPS